MELTEHNHVDVSSLGSFTLLINLFMSTCNVMLVWFLISWGNLLKQSASMLIFLELHSADELTRVSPVAFNFALEST